MENTIIKVIDGSKADELIALGGKYTKEIVNGKEVYTFFMSDEIAKYIQSKFSTKDYHLTNKLTF